MIAQLNGHITQKQVDEIVIIIINKYSDYKKLMNSALFRSVFIDEYAPHNKQHSVSWAISSAFPSESVVAENLQVSCLNYSGGYSRPELSNDRVIVHVLNHTTNFKAEYLKHYYSMNDCAFRKDRLYCYVKFEAKGNELVNISLCLPDPNGDIVEEVILLNRTRILELVS